MVSYSSSTSSRWILLDMEQYLLLHIHPFSITSQTLANKTLDRTRAAVVVPD